MTQHVYSAICNTLPWVLSVMSGLVIWLMGKKKVYAPAVGIFTQCLWYVYVIMTSQVGLLIGVTLYMICHIVNHRKWNKMFKEGTL